MPAFVNRTTLLLFVSGFAYTGVRGRVAALGPGGPRNASPVAGHARTYRAADAHSNHAIGCSVNPVSPNVCANDRRQPIVGLGPTNYGAPRIDLRVPIR